MWWWWWGVTGLREICINKLCRVYFVHACLSSDNNNNNNNNKKCNHTIMSSYHSGDFTFYMPSDAGRAGDTAGSFTIDLDIPMVFNANKDYQVALRELVIPRSIEGYGESSVIGLCAFNTTRKKYLCEETVSKLVEIRLDDFNSVNRLLLKLRDTVNSLGSQLALDGHKCTIDFASGWDSVTQDKVQFKVYLELPIPSTMFYSFPAPPRLSVSGAFQSLLCIGDETEYVLTPDHMTTQWQKSLFSVTSYIPTTTTTTTTDVSTPINKKRLWYTAPKHMSKGCLRYLQRRFEATKNFFPEMSMTASLTGRSGFVLHFRVNTRHPPVQNAPEGTVIWKITILEPWYTSAGGFKTGKRKDGRPMGCVLRGEMPPEAHKDGQVYGTPRLDEQCVPVVRYHWRTNWIQWDIEMPTEGITDALVQAGLEDRAAFDYKGPSLSKTKITEYVRKTLHGRTHGFSVKLLEGSGSSIVDEGANFVGDQMDGVVRHVNQTASLEVVYDPTKNTSIGKQFAIGFQTPIYRPLKRSLAPLNALRLELHNDDTGQVMTFGDKDMKSIATFHVEEIKRRRRTLPPEFSITIPANEEVKLTHPFTLDRGYRVALVQALLPYGFVNVRKDEMGMQIKKGQMEYLRAGVYSNETLLNICGTMLQQHGLRLKKNAEDRVEIIIISSRSTAGGTPVEQETEVILTNALSAVLGFGSPPNDLPYIQKIQRDSPMIAGGLVDVMRGYYTLVAYCDQLLKQQLFANSYIAHLAHLTPDYSVQGTGSNKTFKYEPPSVMYKKLIANLLPQGTLRVDITDALGRPLEYTDYYYKRGGIKPKVDLHFKLE